MTSTDHREAVLPGGPSAVILDLLARPPRSSDHHFVIDSWLRSYRHDSHFARHLTDQIFYSNHRQIIQTILGRAQTVIACLPADQDAIAGYIVYVPAHEISTMDPTLTFPVLHYVFVKAAYRRMGVARWLLAHTQLPVDLAGVHVSHPTKIWFPIKGMSGLRDKFPTAVYDPYAII